MSDFDPLTFDPENIDPEELAELAGEEKGSDNLESARASLDDIAPEHRVPEGFRSGFVAIVGRPNVGKSTLVNALVGRKVVITSDRPETTRRDIRAIMTHPDSQLVLVDTPGIHRPRTLLGRRLDDMVDESLSEVDAVCFLLPADQKIGPGDERILRKLQDQFARTKEEPTSPRYWRKPVICVVTKIDQLSKKKLVDKLIEVDQFGHFSEIVAVSALEGDNTDEMAKVLINAVPEGPKMYPDDVLTEESAEQTIAELIREAFLEELNDELPHSLAVVVDDIVKPEPGETDENGNPAKAHVYVSLYVERDSQKPIIIGRKAKNLVYVKKRVRTAVNRAVGMRSSLDLHVKLARDWQSDPRALNRFGF